LCPVIWRDVILLISTSHPELELPFSLEVYSPATDSSAVITTTDPDGQPIHSDASGCMAALIRDGTAVLVVGGGKYGGDSTQGYIIDLKPIAHLTTNELFATTATHTNNSSNADASDGSESGVIDAKRTAIRLVCTPIGGDYPYIQLQPFNRALTWNDDNDTSSDPRVIAWNQFIGIPYHYDSKANRWTLATPQIDATD
jgi:hypothetical protein